MCNSNFKGSYALEFMLNFYLKDQPAFYIYILLTIMEKTYQFVIPINNYNSIMGLDTWSGPSENEYQSWGYIF